MSDEDSIPQSPAVGREIRERLGRQLKNYYAVTGQLPLTARLVDLIERLSQQAELNHEAK